jgi:hypothetical protein
MCLRLAHTRTARLLSLRRTKLSTSEALVLPHRTKVNTVAFREHVDVIFVDKQWLPIYTEFGVSGWRFLHSRFARSVVFAPAGRGQRVMAGLREQSALLQATAA